MTAARWQDIAAGALGAAGVAGPPFVLLALLAWLAAPSPGVFGAVSLAVMLATLAAHAAGRRWYQRDAARAAALPDRVAVYLGRRPAFGGLALADYVGKGDPAERVSVHRRRTAANRRRGRGKVGTVDDGWSVVRWYAPEVVHRAERNRIAALGPVFRLTNKHKRHDFGMVKTRPDAGALERARYVVGDVARLWFYVFIEPVWNPAAAPWWVPATDADGPAPGADAPPAAASHAPEPVSPTAGGDAGRAWLVD